MSFDFRTLALQAVNVLILIWLLQRFFWRPVAAIIEQRRAAASSMLEDAAKRQEEVAAAQAGIETVRQGFAQERTALLAAAQGEAEAIHKAAETQAAAAVREMEEMTRAHLAAEQEAARISLRREAAELAVEIAGRLVARLDGPELRGAFLEGSVQEIAALPGDVRHGIGALTVTTAKALSREEQAACAARLRAALGEAAEIGFVADPALLGGLEVQGGNLRLSNSWRVDLARIREGLSHEHG
jgi:F-type H+-transporting ATPase subunit b